MVHLDDTVTGGRGRSTIKEDCSCSDRLAKVVQGVRTVGEDCSWREISLGWLSPPLFLSYSIAVRFISLSISLASLGGGLIIHIYIFF